MSAMLLSPRRTVTIDFDQSAIRLLVARGRRVDRWASAPVEPGLIDDGLIADPPALGAKIKRLMKAGDISGSRVIASLTGLYSITRLVRIPPSPIGKKEDGDTVLQAARSALPIALDELYLSWQTLETNELGSLALIIATPRYIVDAQMAALEYAGIRPRALNLKSLALIALVDSQHALIANLEPESIDISLVADGLPQVVRTISQKPDIPLEERVDNLVRNLEITTLFYDNQVPGSKIGLGLPLFLAGRMAEDPDVLAMIQQRVPFPIAPFAVPMEVPKGLPVSEYAINVGLAWSELPLPPATREEEPLTAETDENE